MSGGAGLMKGGAGLMKGGAGLMKHGAGLVRWAGYALGCALVVLGLTGIVLDSNPSGWALWFGGVLLAHDLVLAPAVLLAGIVLAGRADRWLRAALIVAGLVTLATLPTVLALGRRADNPSILPQDYGRNLLLVLGTVGLAALAPRCRTRTVALGLAAGAAAGVLVASLMAVNGMVDLLQGVLFVGQAAVLGAVLGGFFGARLYNLANAFACGLIVGLIGWVAWQLTVLPILLGGSPTWTITPGTFRALVGEVLLGGITGVLLFAALSRLPVPATAPALTTAGTAAPRVVIVGGGFGGWSAARRLDRLIARGLRAEVTLVSDSTALLFTPMLAGVAGGALEAGHVSVPVRATLTQTSFVHARAESIDTEKRQVRLTGAAMVPYDQLVLAVGSIPSFHGLPGLAEHAYTLKTVGDATRLRDHVLDLLERADLGGGERAELLTFVVAGGGFAGAELVAELFDLVHGVLHRYPGIHPAEPRFVLLHGGDRILPELPATLGAYAHQKLARRGIDVRLRTRVAGAGPEAVELRGGEEIRTRTLVWTAGNRPHPLGAGLPDADACLRVPGRAGVWTVGDCARIPGPDGAPYPPTAQHAQRQGRAVADNIAAVLAGGRPAEFRYQALGTLVALGHRTAVAELLGRRLSGFAAWALWRVVYLAKLPRLVNKLRVVTDLAFPRDVQ
ncbi:MULTISPECIES: NAD(P)/FAD-dependent oxidoreductase [unclassified Nonomuraea]|uniref:NAD(P)/FAD-dependent oxidoreductase n=1 Tax=unclassified Nonomuraea TaxID=2593643 RepID=UPI0033D9625C